MTYLMHRRRWLAIATDCRGAAALEFAVLAPVLMLILAGATDLAFAAHGKLQAHNAAGAGAYYALAHGWDREGIVGAVENAASENVYADRQPTISFGCVGNSELELSASPVKCADGSEAKRYVTVYAASHRPSVFPNWIALPETMTAKAVVQIP